MVKALHCVSQTILVNCFFITEKMREAYGNYKRLQLSLMELYNFSGIVKQSERLGVISQVCLIYKSINKPRRLPSSTVNECHDTNEPKALQLQIKASVNMTKN